jgi:ankyrin repeat protein
LEVVKYLIENGVNIYCTDELETFPIHYVCCNLECDQSFEITEYLIENSVDLNYVDKYGTPLLHKIYQCHFRKGERLINCLVANGVDINCTDSAGKCLIHHICSVEANVCFDDETIKYLVANGASVSRFNRDGERNKLLSLARCRCAIDMYRFLEENGAINNKK